MLNMNPVVRVNVSVGANSVSAGVFDVGALITPEAGTGTALTTTSRFAVYTDLAEVLNGVTGTKPAFAATTETYKAAAKYFGVSPAPGNLVVIFYDTTEGTEDTPTIALLDAVDKGAEIYGVYYIPKASETDANIKTNTAALVSALEGLERGVLFYGFTGTVASAITAGSLLRTMAEGGSKRVMGMYCTTDINDAAGLMGIAMGYSRANETGNFALCYKAIASATANSISQSEVESLQSYNGNVYVARTRTGAKLEKGATASGLRFDEVLYIDRIVKDIQDSVYNMIANATGKLPQNDGTTTLFKAEVKAILEAYYGYGVLATAQWRGGAIAGVATGDIVEHGYLVYAESFDTQSALDRAARKAMPLTILICLSGAVESIVINLNVQT